MYFNKPSQEVANWIKTQETLRDRLDKARAVGDMQLWETLWLEYRANEAMDITEIKKYFGDTTQKAVEKTEPTSDL